MVGECWGKSLALQPRLYSALHVCEKTSTVHIKERAAANSGGQVGGWNMVVMWVLGTPLSHFLILLLT